MNIGENDKFIWNIVFFFLEHQCTQSGRKDDVARLRFSVCQNKRC